MSNTKKRNTTGQIVLLLFGSSYFIITALVEQIERRNRFSKIIFEKEESLNNKHVNIVEIRLLKKIYD